MKTRGRFTIAIRGSTERTQKVMLSSWSGFHYLMQRLLTGDEVAGAEFEHYGVAIEVFAGDRCDPWEHDPGQQCPHSWVEITMMNDLRRRWLCSICDAEISKGR